jgi:hypothetical protein
MRMLTVNLYQYDELQTEEAKERAREWFAEGLFDFDWWDSTYEDAERIGLKITSFDCDRYEISGELMDTVNGICGRILKEHGKTCSTYKLARTIDRRKRNDSEDAIEEFRRALCEEYLQMLRNEADYIQSRESIEENIRANEYEFTEEGKRA